MSISSISLKSNIRDYNAFFVDSCDFLEEYKKTENKVFIVDENVWKHHADGCLSLIKDSDTLVLPISEEAKCLDSVLTLYDQMLERSAKRNITIISIGGGITQDITGYAASTLYRGVNWVYVPTTLLAQADSCVGSKTSLNYKHFKNLVGTFYPPTSIYIYSQFLDTLQDFDYYSGVGEVVKLHLMGGEEKIEKLVGRMDQVIDKDHSVMTDVIRDSLLIKKGYMEDDEFDLGRRNMLNFGHCFGHALESATDFMMPHGQAVTLGMIIANKVAKNRGLLNDALQEHINQNILWPAVKLPEKAFSFDNEAVVEAMKQDKKRIGEDLALVMLTDSHEMVKVTDLAIDEALASLKQFQDDVCRV
ncbi:hypothetical protein LCGC14_2442360 [marine sediment metagenome]|uniref:Uncharacterized protein n=1 Tax=marine sediment metagenome TaxID=412755 RepID=A0A0F9BIS8_9ZZZZ